MVKAGTRPAEGNEGEREALSDHDGPGRGKDPMMRSAAQCVAN